MYDLIIRDATIVRPNGRLVADIAVENGKIADVGGRVGGPARTEISAIGRFVMPGVIDGRVHFRDPGFPHKEDWASGSRAAVAAGVTTVLDMPNTRPPTVDAPTVKAKLQAAGRSSAASFGAWIGATRDNLDEAGSLWEDGLVCGIVLGGGDYDGELPVTSRTIGEAFHKTRGLLAIHAEDQDVLDRVRKKFDGRPSPIHNDVRPPEAALSAVQRVIDLVKGTRRPVHLCHVSTAVELNALDPYRGDLPITCEVTPHHLFLSVETVQSLGNRVKTNPPVRPELDRKALWTAVKRGRVDVFASDHSPHTREEKGRPYWKVPDGIPGVDTLFPLLMGSVKNGRIGLERLVDMCCETPARVFGLKWKGHILQGYDADILLFSEGAVGRLRREDLHTRVGWSPYLGREVAACPETVVVNGRIVARRGKLVDEVQPGKAVEYARN